MSKNCPIMQRMKENYEVRSRTYLTRRTPVILRIDGKAFHTYTRGLEKPFDSGLVYDMMDTTVYLCSKIQGAKCGYAQSDEISILLTDYDNLQTSAWFDYEVQKMCSIAASHAATKFNQLRYIREIAKLNVGVGSLT
jgi:tRNA(His) guanylyltransferase